MSIEQTLMDRREAIRHVTAMLGGVALVGGSSLIAACERGGPRVESTPGTFTADEIAFLDEIADTILPDTKTPGAKAAKTGAFMALMVSDTYSPEDQKIFRDGMGKVNDATQRAHNVSFMAATPPQRLAVLTALDREQKIVMDARDAADRRKRGLAPVAPAKELDQAGVEIIDVSKITADTPVHYFRMMKELALLGYFTSEIGYTKAMRYAESPGRFDPCAPYTPGEPSWAPHA
jgi:hypothetical protein